MMPGETLYSILPKRPGESVGCSAQYPSQKWRSVLHLKLVAAPICEHVTDPATFGACMGKKCMTNRYISTYLIMNQECNDHIQKGTQCHTPTC